MEEEGASRCYPRVITAVSSRFAARIGRKTRFWRILPTVHLGSRCSAIESRRSRPVGRSCGDLAAFRFVSKKQREREREREEEEENQVRFWRGHTFERKPIDRALRFFTRNRSIDVAFPSPNCLSLPFVPCLLVSLVLHVCHGQRCYIVLYIVTITITIKPLKRH